MSRFFFTERRCSGNIVANNGKYYGIRQINLDNFVKFCRKAFGNRYRDMWIVPVYFDNRYLSHTDEFFPEVGVYLVPRTRSLAQALKANGITPPCKNAPSQAWEAYRGAVWEVIWSDIEDYCFSHPGHKLDKVVITAKRTPSRQNPHEYVEKILNVGQVDKFPEEFTYKY